MREATGAGFRPALLTATVPDPTSRRTSGHYLTTVVLVPVGVKVALVLLTLLYLHLGWWRPDTAASPLQAVLAAFGNADSGWYHYWFAHGAVGRVAREPGWSVVHQHLAFFPLYPLLLRALAGVFGGAFAGWATVVGMSAASAAAGLLFQLLRDWFSDAALAFRTTVLVFVLPLHLHFYTYYTEALYLLLLVGALRAAQGSRWGWLALCGVLLTLVRPNGIAAAVPLALLLAERWAAPPEFAHPSHQTRPEHRLSQLAGRLLWLLPMAGALAAYCWYLHRTVGDALAFVHAQAGWHKEPMWPWLALFRRSYWQTQLLSGYCLLVTALVVGRGRRLPVSLHALFWLALLLPLSAGSTVSVSRYLAVAFPWVLLLAEALGPRGFRWSLVGCAAGAAATWLLWLRGDMLLY